MKVVSSKFVQLQLFLSFLKLAWLVLH